MKPFVVLFALLTLSSSLFAQTNRQTVCGTRDHPGNEELKVTQPFLFKTTDLMPGGISTYVIPCVVHVLHDGNPATADTVPAERIRHQFVQAFRDLRALPGTAGVSGLDTRIELALCTKDPNGQATTGIVYHTNLASPSVYSDYGILQQVQGLQWDTHRYLNIYLIDSIISGTEEVTFGIAVFPWDQLLNPAVVIRKDVFGSEGIPDSDFLATVTSVNGRTLIHELGHYLGLYHTFEGGCQPGDCALTGDRVCDTPPERSNAAYLSPDQNGCRNDVPDQYDDITNHMGYASETWRNHFTQGQVTRMYGYLNTTSIPRVNNVWQENNLMQTGTGKYGPAMARFWSNKQVTCTGAPVSFIPYVAGQPHIYRWAFEGGTPASSTDPRPQVTYTSPGLYDVKLYIKNEGGYEDSIVVQNFVEVRDNLKALPYTEGFETGVNLPAEMVVIDENKPAYFGPSYLVEDYVSWIKRTNLGAGGSSGSAMVILPFCHQMGTREHLITPTLNAAQAADLSVAFTYHYLPVQVPADPGQAAPPILADTLVIAASRDCGVTWQTVFKKGGVQLSSHKDSIAMESNISSSSFQWWKRDSVSLADFAGEASVQVRFTTISQAGNSLLLDDILVDAFHTDPEIVTGRSTPNQTGHLTIYPNPTHHHLNIEGLTGESLQLELINTSGSTVYSQPVNASQMTLDVSHLPAGLYLLSVKNRDGSQQHQRVIIQ